MANSTITSLAILTVNWEDRKKGYLDNFIPFLVESIRHKDSEAISANEVRASVQSEFGLRLPVNIIKSLLPDLERQGYIRLQSATNLPNGLKTYTPNWDNFRNSSFSIFSKMCYDSMRSLSKASFPSAKKSTMKAWKPKQQRRVSYHT